MTAPPRRFGAPLLALVLVASVASAMDLMDHEAPHTSASAADGHPRLKLELAAETPANITVERWLEVRSALVSSKEERGPLLTNRKEVREMTCEEWDGYVKAVTQLYESEHWTKYRKVHENERQLIWDLSHSDARQELFTFLPWHRLWLRGIERELQKIDPNIAIPYWNWALDSADPLNSPVLSDHYFGGNGDPENGDCIMGGVFEDLTLVANATIFEEDPDAEGATCCIKRYMPEESGGLLTLANIKDLLIGAEDFSSFNLMIENGPGLLGYMQMFVGGENAKTSKDPLFLSMYAFADMLWWKWQRMHDGMNNPANTFRGNRKEVLLPFEEKVEDVFSVEEMGYTYASPLEDPSSSRKQGLDEEKPCYTAQKGGRIDIALLGHQVFEKLPNNITELVKIPRKTSLLSVDVWRRWVQQRLKHSQVPTAMELEGDLKMWSHLASWPSFNNSNWRSQEDYGLGVPLSMLMPDFFLQQELSGSQNRSENHCDYLTIKERCEPTCIVKRPKTNWYLNTFHTCIEDCLGKMRTKKMEEMRANGTAAPVTPLAAFAADQEESPQPLTFDYLSHDHNTNDEVLDAAILEEAEEILTHILYMVIDPIVKYEDQRYLVQAPGGEMAEVEAEDAPEPPALDAALLDVSREEAIDAPDTPTDEGEKLYNLADDIKEAMATDPALIPKPEDFKSKAAYLEALKQVNSVFNRAYYIQNSGRSGWRLAVNQNSFQDMVSRSPLGRFNLLARGK